jgi:hypothetical protein
MKGDVGGTSDYPAIVRRRSDVENRARQQIEARAIFILDYAMPRQDSAGVRGMTERGAGGRGIVDGPLPAGLIGGATKRDAGYMHDFKSPERKFADFIRPLERLQDGV